MCGIAGIFSYKDSPVREREVRAMCSAIVHRGPDDEGVYVAGRAGLGMRRLSIIDLDASRQPIRNEDGSVFLVFNGEIYNYKELREKLARLGHRFYTQGDTETIVHLYEEYGDHCVDHLRGMFAFALWDGRNQRMLIARDRLGIKPLYYAEVSGRLLFASELKSILQLPEVERKINWNSVSHLFSSLYTPPAESAIEGIHKLEPGYTLAVSPGKPPVLHRYWDIEFEPDRGKGEAYFIGRLRELLDESVRLHMVSDVPLGAFLSGGIDSSSIVATAANLIPEPLRTFSIGFPEPEYNELDAARCVANKFATDHHELMLEPGSLRSFEEITWHLDEPFGDSSAIPTFMVSKLAAGHVKVVLSGDGGDELFAGYDKYVVESRKRARRPLPAPARRVMGIIAAAMPEGARGRNFLRNASQVGMHRYFDSCTFFRWEELGHLLHADVLQSMSPPDPARGLGDLEAVNSNWLTQLQRLDVKRYLPLDILTKVDRMSMAHSLETRVPLLDHKVVEFAATIPPEMQLKNGTTKYILKQAMRGILPDNIIDRPKHGFAVPLRYWFRGNLASYTRELLLSSTAQSRGIFNSHYIEKLLTLQSKGRDLDLQLWTLISFELWSRVFLDAAVAQEAA